MFKQAAVFRGFAIFLVIVDHTIAMGQLGLGRINLPPGTLLSTVLNVLASFSPFAVPIFLFFSGCYINYVLEKRDFKASYKIIFTTITSVLWPYLIWSCLFYIVIFLDGGQSFSILGYVKNLIVGYPYNFVPILIFFYLISPLLSKIRGLKALFIVGFFFLYQIFLIYLLDPAILGFSNIKFMQFLAVPVLKDTLRTWGIYFPLGFYIKSIMHISDSHKKVVSICLGIATLIIVMINLVATIFNYQWPWVKYIVVVPFILLSVLWEREKFPFYKAFERLGKRSYGLYLINLVIFDLSILIFTPILLINSDLMVLYFIILFAITIFLPVLLMDWIEKILNRKVYRFVFG